MTIAQQIEAKGIEKGRLEGEQATKEAIAQKLWQQGMSLDSISQLTELPLAELQTFLAMQDANH